MVLLATMVLPHGTAPFDGDANSASEACRERNAKLEPTLRDKFTKLYEGTLAACEVIAALQPDFIVLHTPHGLCLSDAYGVYANDDANGNAEWLHEWTEFEAAVNLDAQKSTEFKNFLSSRIGGPNVTVQGIRSFSGMETKLRWGEVVPLWYLQRNLKNDPKYMIVSNDTRPYTMTLEDWRLNVGACLAEFVEQLAEKVLVVVSGDLSHHHPTDCDDPLYLPDPSANMPVDPAGSAAYEAAIQSWVQSGPIKGPEGPTAEYSWDPVMALIHLTTASGIDPPGACGAKGFAMMQGLLTSAMLRGATFTSRVFTHEVPTYYGMMAATFIKD